MGHKKKKSRGDPKLKVHSPPKEVVEKVYIGKETKTTLKDIIPELPPPLEQKDVVLDITHLEEPKDLVVAMVPCDKDGNPYPELSPEEKAQIQGNIDDREAAEDTLKMIAQEFGDMVGNRYWEIIRDAGIEKAGMPMKPEIKELAPFDDVRANVFMKQTLPRWKYADVTVAAVEKKEGLDFLERLATKPDYFQRGLSRYVEWRKKNPPKKAKKKRKKK